MKHHSLFKYPVIAFLVILLSSCGGSQIESNTQKLLLKKDSLIALKKELSVQISALDEEIKLSDSTGNQNLAVVTVAPVQSGIFRHFFKVQGVVETDKNAQINAEVAAKIITIKVREGQHVKQGELLLELDSKVLMGNIEELKTQLELANTIYERQKSLWDQKMGSEIQYLESKSNKESLENRLSTLNSQLDYYKIKSPFNGIVDEIFPKEGESAIPGIPLLRVLNLDKVYLKADISENYLGKIKEGDTSIIRFSGAGIEIKSRINRIGDFINPNNRTFKVRFDLNNENHRLIPNMLAEVEVMDYNSPVKRIIVPLKLIQETPSGEEFVYKLGENSAPHAEKVFVKPGISFKGSIEVLEGLSENDVLIVQGARSVKDGEVVSVVEN